METKTKGTLILIGRGHWGNPGFIVFCNNHERVRKVAEQMDKQLGIPTEHLTGNRSKEARDMAPLPLLGILFYFSYNYLSGLMRTLFWPPLLLLGILFYFSYTVSYGC